MIEQVGVPATAVMTSEFVSAAELMARVLGAEGFPFVVIEHPIASASSDGLARRAAEAASDCADFLTRT